MALVRPTMNVQIGTMKLRNPMVLLSGTAGYGYEMTGLIDLKKIGALTAKTISLLPREGNRPPRITEVYGGVLNAIGLENPGVDLFIKEYWPRIKRLPCAAIVSVGGHSEEEIGDIVEKLDALSGLEAIELNLSCPNVRATKLISQCPKLTAAAVRSARERTDKTIIAKLTVMSCDLVEIAQAAQEAGADAACLINTVPAMKIDTVRRKPVLGNGYGGLSGRCIKPIGVAAVYKVYAATGMSIIASGGVYNVQDALEYILAGAIAVGVGTATFTWPDRAATIADELCEYMKKQNVASVYDLRGVAHNVE